MAPGRARSGASAARTEDAAGGRSGAEPRRNRRGLESRRRFLATAVDTLASEGPASASANLIARRAGCTWGTVQHQFGDADGVWAALVDALDERVGQVERARLAPPARGEDALGVRVAAVIGVLWEGAASRDVRAVESLRLALPRDPEVLARELPKTEAAYRRLTATWEGVWSQLFAGLPVPEGKLRQVRSLLPGAIRGLRMEADLFTLADPEEGVRALTDSVVAYLEAGSG